MNTMELVKFEEDLLECTQDDQGTIWLVVNRVCENLGLSQPAQHKKLKRAKWAGLALKAMPDPTGTIQEQFCIDLESAMLWLAKIEPSRCKPAIRPKLLKYQREVKEVIYRHFTGGHEVVAFDYDRMGLVVGRAVGEQLRPMLQPINDKLDSLDTRVGVLEKGKRKRIKDSTKFIHRQVIRQWYGLMCPCCDRERVISDDGIVIGQYDHFYDLQKVEVYQTWLICAKCNQRRYSDIGFRESSLHRFKVYQDRVEQSQRPLL